MGKNKIQKFWQVFAASALSTRINFVSQDDEDSGKLKKPVQYLDDVDDIVDYMKNIVDKYLDECPDHEPIYQAADQEDAFGKKFLLTRISFAKKVNILFKNES